MFNLYLEGGVKRSPFLDQTTRNRIRTESRQEIIRRNKRGDAAFDKKIANLTYAFTELPLKYKKASSVSKTRFLAKIVSLHSAKFKAVGIRFTNSATYLWHTYPGKNWPSSAKTGKFPGKFFRFTGRGPVRFRPVLRRESNPNRTLLRISPPKSVEDSDSGWRNVEVNLKF